MKLRYTIYMLLVIAVLALAVGWWIDHKRMESSLEQTLTEMWKENALNWRYHKFRAAWTSALLESAQNTPPTPELTAEVIEAVRHDPDPTIKVRAMAILPYVKEREQAIDVLIDATKDRDDESSGSGLVPLYATTYLAEMKATRAIDAIEDWVAFLKHPYAEMYDKGAFGNERLIQSWKKTREMGLKKNQEDLETLKASAESASH